KNITSILLELFGVIILSAITAYIASRGITALGDQLIPSFGAMGWWIIGAIAALTAGFLGVGWTFYCDDQYRN
ncbi:MAG: hypothetical protein RLZZ381_2797, partial [Cyanobacteriota bacterium]